MAAETGSRLAFMTRALRHRNYRLFFMGQLVSLIGTWMTTVATSWLVYRLTGSAWLLGVVGFAGTFPAFLLAPVAGAFVDRWNRHRLLVLTQTLSMLESFALALLTFSGRISVPWIVGLSAFQGLVNAFDMPCRQSFVVEMIEDRADLGNAIALNSSMVNAARLLGPSIGGIIIAAWGEGWCFFFDGASYLAVIAALLAMRVGPAMARTREGRGLAAELLEGWRYAYDSAPIRSVILLLALVSLVGVPYGVLMPVFAKTVLNGGAHTLGFLMAASGCGALLGAAWLAARRSAAGLIQVVPGAAAAFGLGLIAFSFSRDLWLSLPLMMAAGCGFMIQMAASNTILQTLVDDDKRGRVMSLYMMAFMGTVPFGSLFAGSLAQRVGAPQTLLLGGSLCVAGALAFASGLPGLEAARPAPAVLAAPPQEGA